MNTYRVYVLDTKIATAPVVHVAHIRTDGKYKGAWEGARAACSGKDKAPLLYSDAACTETATFGHGDDITVAKIVDIKPRNVKLDKTAMQAILNDPEATAEAKLEAMQLMLA